VTYWPKAVANGVVVKTRARVREINVGADGLADGAVYYDADGRIRKQRARFVVMACNGIGTPRLLLGSKSSLFPDGLANSSGLVGKNLMFHPYAITTGVFDERLDGYMGPIGCNIISQEFYETDLSRGFVRGYAFQGVRSSGPINTALGGMGGPRVPWGDSHHRVMDARFGRTMTLAAIGEDLPELHNTVTLDPDLTDSDGIPAPKVTYKMSENSLKMMDHALARGTEALEAAGAQEVMANPLLRPSGWHLMGTARMGTDGGSSVVDGSGRSHDVRNLFIIDGSIFVTSGGVNPTATIQTLALYIADEFKRNARHLLK